ncbi:MAG: NAD(P)/FAD-dependent oxidoreductase [Chloroflexi bacterium]|nr:NAD(P)/FAD-dependent oxidoreductase [Chloroflexota bacterium]
MYDAIVIGARAAGAPTAMLLARKGYRVLLVDKARFPSDILSSHYIHQPGVARLQRWSLLDRLAATGCPPIRRMTIDASGVTLSGTASPVDAIDAAYAPRRIVLDKLLVDAAVEAGVEVREGFAVREILAGAEPDTGAVRVSGIRGRTRDGAEVTETACIVIGADGKRSRVARAVQAPLYLTAPALTCTYYTYWRGVAIDGLESYPREGQLIAAFPTHDGLTCITVAWPAHEFPRVRADIGGSYLAALEQAPGLAARVRRAEQAERFYGSVDLPNFFRKPWGAGWALVGDAGHTKDPISAAGITDGFRDAELLAEAVDAGFSGRLPLEDALAWYEQARNEAAVPRYIDTYNTALLPAPAPQNVQLMAALRRDPAATSRFLGVAAGTVREDEFFTPDMWEQFLGPSMAPAEAAA